MYLNPQSCPGYTSTYKESAVPSLTPTELKSAPAESAVDSTLSAEGYKKTLSGRALEFCGGN